MIETEAFPTAPVLRRRLTFFLVVSIIGCAFSPFSLGGAIILVQRAVLFPGDLNPFLIGGEEHPFLPLLSHQGTDRCSRMKPGSACFLQKGVGFPPPTLSCSLRPPPPFFTGGLAQMRYPLFLPRKKLPILVDDFFSPLPPPPLFFSRIYGK